MITAQRLPNLLNDALDEIYWLRTALAYEGAITATHLAFKTFPSNRRRFCGEQTTQMFLAARGKSARAYAGTSYLSLDGAMLDAGAAKTLGLGDWAAGKGSSSITSALADDRIEPLRADLDRAVEEIWRLRRALAYEAVVLGAHAYGSTFPRRCKKTISEQVDRMQAAARGDVWERYRDLNSDTALRAAGAATTLTMAQWAQEANA